MTVKNTFGLLRIEAAAIDKLCKDDVYLAALPLREKCFILYTLRYCCFLYNFRLHICLFSAKKEHLESELLCACLCVVEFFVFKCLAFPLPLLVFPSRR